MSKGRTVMILGLGTLGYQTLKMLLVTPGFDKIIGGDINEDVGSRRVNFAYTRTTTQTGYYPEEPEFVKINLLDVEKTAEILEKYNPDLVFQCATVMSWWVEEMLPEDVKSKLDPAGVWAAPLHALLPHKLALALKEANLFGKIHYVQGSFPDCTNPILRGAGLAPTTGIGNIGNYTMRIKYVAAKRLNVPMNDVEVYAVFPHIVAYNLGKSNGSTLGAPYYLKVLLRGEDVTAKVDPGQELKKGWPEFPKMLRGDVREYGSIAAASAARIIRGILFNTKEITHAPGPNGLPGGYPVRLSNKGVEVVLPKDITLKEAIRLNNEIFREYEGVERIEDDGTLVCTDKAYKLIKEALGYDFKSCKVEELNKRAKELADICKEIGKKLGWTKVPIFL